MELDEKMDRYQIMYMYEHRLLPHWFYEDKLTFVGMILKDKSILYKIIDDIFAKEGVENPYQENQFDIDKGRISEDIVMLKIIFPEPEAEPFCYCSYMFFDLDFNHYKYYCIEKGGEASDDAPFVCGWTSDGTHENYGTCSLKDDDDFRRCAKLFMDGLKDSSEQENQ